MPTESRDRSSLEGEGEEGDGRGGGDRGAEDPLVLVGPDAEVAPVVGAVAPEDDQPAQRQPDVRDEHEQLPGEDWSGSRSRPARRSEIAVRLASAVADVVQDEQRRRRRDGARWTGAGSDGARWCAGRRCGVLVTSTVCGDAARRLARPRATAAEGRRLVVTSRSTDLSFAWSRREPVRVSATSSGSLLPRGPRPRACDRRHCDAAHPV